MDQITLDWLLEGPTWLRFAVERQLLNMDSDVRPAFEDQAIRVVVDRLKDSQSGLPALQGGKTPYSSPAYWDLYFLADIGLTIQDTGLTPEAEMIFDLQLLEGSFRLADTYKPKYYCIPAILLTPLVRMGYRDDPRTHKFIQLNLESQRLDGGWHCSVSRALGKKLEDSPSCPMDNLNILMLLGQYEKFRHDVRFNGAIDLLLTHWERRDEPWRPYGFGIGTHFSRLRYPAVKYGILRVLDALSLFPYGSQHPTFKEMLDYVRLKSQDGKYRAESIMMAYKDLDFGQKKEPSRWLTFIISRIEQRAAGSINR